MKLLSKKWHRIPVAAIFVPLLIVGAALTAYVSIMDLISTEITEPISVSEKEFKAPMYLGETNSWTSKITNAASVPYDITYKCAARTRESAFITGFKINGTNHLQDQNGNNPGTVKIKLIQVMFIRLR